MNRDTYKKTPLKAVLNMAYAQAMLGKGIERHGSDKPFVEQVSMSDKRIYDECGGLGL